VAEITEQEAREAVGRICQAISDEVKGIIDADTAERLYGTRDLDVALELGRDDLKKAVEFARQELARRDAERVEREKPIDEEWLRSIATREYAGVNDPYFIEFELHEDAVSAFTDKGKISSVQMNWSSGLPIKTRGQLLDLLNALRGGAT